MYRLRSTRFLLQRRLFLRDHLSISADDADFPVHVLLRPGRTRKRRYFSSDHGAVLAPTNSGSSSNIDTDERKLESYTSYVLKSQRVPLGTLSPDEWDDVVAATNMWTTQMGTSGFAIDNAERLLQRLQYEVDATSSVVPNYSNRRATLREMRLALLNSWLNLLTQHPTSTLALSRSETALFKVLEMEHDSFPVAEILRVLDGWRDLPTAEGTRRAVEFLMSCTTDPYQPYLKEFSTELTVRFDRVIADVLDRIEHTVAQELSYRLLERMDHLKHDAKWDGMELSEATLQALEEMSFQSYEDSEDRESSGGTSAEISRATLSSFEATAMTNRITEMLRKAGPEDQQEVAKIMPRIEAIQDPSEELLVSLVDYYLRIGDAPSASSWIPKIPASTLLSTESEGARPSLTDRLLDSWSLQKHPRAPWRAEEIFRQILDRVDSSGPAVPVATMNRLLRIWSSCSDPAANRKVREWFSRMTESMHIKPDGTSLYLVVKALDSNSSASETLFERILNEWGSWDRDEKQAITNTLIQVLSHDKDLTSSALTLLTRIKEDGLELSREKYFLLLQKALVVTADDLVVQTVEKLNGESNKVDSVLYEAAIHSLLKRDGKHLHSVEILWRRALERMANSGSSLDPDDFEKFLTGVVAKFANWKHYGAGESFLNEAERLFAADRTSNKGSVTWPIPLGAYKCLVVRNWYRPDTAVKVIDYCKRLQSLYKDGYTTLRPDQDVYLAYLKATAVTSARTGKLLKILDEMATSYQDDENEICKPHAEAFNVILLAINNDIKNPTAALKASLSVWKRLENWNVAPNTKTINFVIHSTIKGGNAKTTYSQVVQLFRKFEGFGLEPDSHTYHLLITACGDALPEERDDALKLCLKAFGEIRQRGATTVFTYASLTKSLRRLLRGGPALVADKVATSTLMLCYEDGLLAPEVREAYESMISKNIWQKIYSEHVSPDKEEPEEWRRQLPDSNHS